MSVDTRLREAVRERQAAQDALLDLHARVDSAQQLASMGDYDWHIPTDTNTWSENLYRMFGYEPGSRNVDYDAYLQRCHPDDRDRIIRLHQESYATGAPYRMTHRIVLDDGEVRHLLCNGEVLFEDGAPVRMRGTSIDITERVRAEEEREAHALRAREESSRRRAALEINDAVVQGLTAALSALEADDPDAVQDHVRRTLDSARTIITDLVGPLDGPVEPGDLVRTAPSSLAD